MNAKTKILTAFIVATTAGTVLGMLLASEISKSEKRRAVDRTQSDTLLDRFFRRKKSGELTEDVEQSDLEYEQA